MKKCYACQETKPQSEYYKDRSRPGGLSSRCIACDKEKRRKYYEKRGAQEKAANAKWKKQNAKRHSEINCAWSKKNPQYRSRMHKRRSREDDLYRFKRAVRQSLYRCFGYVSEKKRKDSERYLGTSWENAKNHIEAQFQPGMSWKNHGEWHIDHIVPLSSAKNENDVVALSHYTNLQPLWAEDNLSKGARLDYCAN